MTQYTRETWQAFEVFTGGSLIYFTYGSKHSEIYADRNFYHRNIRQSRL